MLMLLCAVTTWAGVTDLPEMSTEGNTKWYTIKNVRRAKYATYAGESTSMTQQSSIQDGSLFYFTGSVADGVATVKIHNAQAGDLLCAGTNSWTAEGIDWYIAAKTATGLSISKTADFSGENSWNDFQGSGTSVDYWTATDAGSIWAIEEFGADIQAVLDEMLANKTTPVMDEYKYDEEKYNALASAYATFKAEANMTNYNACSAIVATLEKNMPEAGKFYVIEAPLFYKVQGVNKGLYVNEEGALGWNTIDLTNKAFYWNVEVVDGKYAIKNVNTSTYINGTAMSETAVYGNLTALGEEQFNIIINGTTVHANGHGNGASASGDVVSWGGSVGSASAWAFIEKNDPDANVPVTVVYNFMYEGVKKYTQTTETIAGENYPAANIALPFGVSSATAPEEVINAGDATEIDGVKTITKELELTVSLPFEYYNSYSEVSQWYYVNVRDDGPTYMYYDSSIEYIKATATEVPSDAKDAYSWAFVGNPFDGFKVVNLLAGSAMVLSSPATPTANQDASQIVRMVTEEGATGNTDWDFIKPTHANAAANCFYIQHPTAPAYALNRQGYNGANTVCYWNSRDTGSAFQVVARPSVQGELEALIATAETELAKISALVGEGYGYYTQSVADALSNAIEVARAVTVADESDVETLRAAINADRRVNIPAAGALIAFQSASTKAYCAGKYVKTVPVVTNYSGAGYAADRDHTQLVFDTFEPATTPSAVFQVIAGDNEGEFKLKNMHTQEYVVSFVKGAQHMGTEANAVAITLKPISEGQIAVFGANNGMPMHAQEAHNVIVTWNAETDNASVWNIINVESFAHVLAMSEVGYATLKLGFDATIPAGVECYYATEAIDENGVLNLAKVEGTILPANTAVIVKLAEGSEAGNYNFTYSATAGTAVEGNKLAGSVYDENITPAGTAYVLSAPDSKVGLYQAALTTDGAFLNNANKAYLVVDGANAAASYSFNFDWAGTTAIEGVVAEGAQDGAIYDITGRRVKAITAPGIYIVNGKKVVK